MDELNRNNLIVGLTFDFAVGITDYCDKLDQLNKRQLAHQLFKSGTSIGANIMEAQSPESRADFIHKVKISAKEAEETHFWLLLCNSIKDLPDVTELTEQLVIIKKVISRIISTSKRPGKI
jgi:four helix bundle protein